MGIDENMSIDKTLHSLFGVSKSSADLLVQEYGKYFDLNTVCFRGGCLTGPNQSGTMLHGFLSYLLKCISTEKEYTIFGYKGKQVRDNIHSKDLIEAFNEYFEKPTKGEVYNIGGGLDSNCSMLEAIKIGEKISEKQFKYQYSENPRIGDHKWYVSDLRKFQKTILVGKLITILPQQWKKFSMRISTDGIRNRILKKIHVIVEIKGGFGNQLFQFAFANSLRKMGYKVKVKTNFYEQFESDNNYENTYRKLVLPETLFGFKKTNKLTNKL